MPIFLLFSYKDLLSDLIVEIIKENPRMADIFIVYDKPSLNSGLSESCVREISKALYDAKSKLKEDFHRPAGKGIFASISPKTWARGAC